MSDQEHEGSITPPPELDYYGPDINAEILDVEQVGKFRKFLVFVYIVIPNLYPSCYSWSLCDSGSL